MENYSIKSSDKQGKISRDQHAKAVLEARNKWVQEFEQCAKEKAELGYENLTWDAVLATSPDESLGTTAQSRIMTLQDNYKRLLEQHKILWIEDHVIEECNKKHAVVHIDQTYILTKKTNIFGWPDFSLESRQSFKAFYEDERIICSDGIERSKADIWLKSPNRNKYTDIIFDPSTTESKDGRYNLWKGFTEKPIQGNCQKYWNHVRDNICNGNEETYNYVRKWIAFVFQHPDQVHTALVLCGSQGVGKDSFVRQLGILLGAHFAPLSSIHELTSNFNFHLKYAVLIHANEALWGGNKKELGTVKSMITESTCLIEGKGKDRITLPYFKHIILSSNEDWPIHLDADDRRCLVLRVSEKHKEDHAYFNAIQEELNNGGYGALLFDLLNEDFTGFNPRIFPASIHAFDIKMRSAESTERYLPKLLLRR